MEKCIFIQSSCFQRCPNSNRWLFSTDCSLTQTTGQVRQRLNTPFTNPKITLRANFNFKFRVSSYLLQIHSQLCKVSRNAALFNYTLSSENTEIQTRTKLCCRVCSSDNKWPSAVVTDSACTLWGLTVETLQYISCKFNTGSQLHQTHNHDKKEEKNQLIFRKRTGRCNHNKQVGIFPPKAPVGAAAK